MAWFDEVPANQNKKLTLDELRKLKLTFGPPKQSPGCKVCGADSVYAVPTDGFFCQWHLPEDAEIVDFDEYMKRWDDRHDKDHGIS